MPAKISTLCYVHDCSDRIAQNFFLKEITAIVKSESNDPTKILFLKIKAFIPVDKDVEHYIDPFEIGDVVYIRGKFIAYESYYMVTATSIKVTDLEFDDMPAIGVGVTITGQTTQIAKTVDGNIVLDFFVEERIGEKEPADFWVEVRHKINNTYLTNRTNAINQKICSTTALLVGTMSYLRPTSNSNEGKHILVLEEISLLSTYVNNKNTNNQGINIPWLSQGSSSARTLNQINRTPRGATPRTPRKDRTTLSQMGPTTLPSPSSILQTALNSNPIPSSTKQTPSGQETQDQNNQTDREFN
ncbi:hypothetical protein F8M41_026311 [Gigaspora margarita]|uniref:Uncharacterized protein n=1 Tax=Gigaspora margarita TaxID=4874 RepID=A0A8H3XJL8_GIGMA|nr:hypothetical protein F8M41_026311 [Gigaspora margarita]